MNCIIEGWHSTNLTERNLDAANAAFVYIFGQVPSYCDGDCCGRNLDGVCIDGTWGSKLYETDDISCYLVNGWWNIYCGPDIDDDGLPDIADNCPDTYNPFQGDFDSDGIGDTCDDCPVDPELDGSACNARYGTR